MTRSLFLSWGCASAVRFSFASRSFLLSWEKAPQPAYDIARSSRVLFGDYERTSARRIVRAVKSVPQTNRMRGPKVGAADRPVK